VITITLFSSLSDDGRIEMPIPAGHTVESLFDFLYAASDLDSFLVKVNGEAAAPDAVISNGDKVTITPRKNEGA